MALSVAAAVAFAGARTATGAESGSRTADRTPAAPTADEVTLGVRDYINANRVRVLAFSGAVSDPQPGQDVEIVGKDCGLAGYRLIAATRTTAGGGFLVENPSSSAPYASTPWASGITFRARWRGELSAPVVYRLSITLAPVKVRRSVWKVQVNPFHSRSRLTGRPVELQRLSDGRWVRYRTARLKLKPSLRLGPFNHEAVFEVRPGLRLRAFLSAQNAAPCWAESTSYPWRS